MRTAASLLLALLIAIPLQHALAQAPDENTTTAAVFIANYDALGNFVGWGSGFYVDDGIIITNKHVIEGGKSYRIFATEIDGTVNLSCWKDITKADVKINLDDDVAYMRAYVDCPHGIVLFANSDPLVGERISVIGYPSQGTVKDSLYLTTSTGSVTGVTPEGWLMTNAHIHFGNSGGPIIGKDGWVAGVAVAMSKDSEGNYVAGYFIPTSVIVKGLAYANDSTFGYVPRYAKSSSSISSVSSTSSTSSLPTEVRLRRTKAGASSASSASSISPFSDVPETSPAFTAIMTLRNQGVISGYSDGTFRPSAEVNRAELLKILVAGFFPQEIIGETDCFSDVRDAWYAPYVCAAKRLGWVSGYEDGTFRPSSTVNRAEAMKMIISSLGKTSLGVKSLPRDVPAESWFSPYVAAAQNIKILTSLSAFHPSLNLTRSDAALWIYLGESSS